MLTEPSLCHRLTRHGTNAGGTVLTAFCCHVPVSSNVPILYPCMHTHTGVKRSPP